MEFDSEASLMYMKDEDLKQLYEGIIKLDRDIKRRPNLYNSCNSRFTRLIVMKLSVADRLFTSN